MTTLAEYVDDVRIFDMETLLAEITHFRPEQIRRAMNEGKDARALEELAGLRVEVDELEGRLKARQ